MRSLSGPRHSAGRGQSLGMARVCVQPGAAASLLCMEGLRLPLARGRSAHSSSCSGSFLAPPALTDTASEGHLEPSAPAS